MVVAIVQARMGSTRLPGKSLMKINDKPILWYVIERLRKCKELDEIVVATSTNEKDDAIEEFCKKQRINFFRGSEEDVLKRFFECAKKNGSGAIARVTADCPLISPLIVDLAVKNFFDKKADYIGNAHFRTFPSGLDVEVFSFSALKKAHKEANKKFEREHVTPYIYHNKDKFKIAEIKSKGKLRRSELRLCIDTKKDFELMKNIFEKFKNPLVPIEKVIAWLDENPKIRDLNKKEEERFRQEKKSILKQEYG